ncbi:MAG: hypothetical protein GY824_07790, partial [Delftia sp.]|nr:hypothetical protein [Delftia sp.]
MVFNPTGGPRTDVVVARLRLPAPPDALQVLAPGGQIVPHQVLADPAGQERPFFNLEASPQEIAVYMGMVQGGRVVSHVVHQVQIQRQGDEAHVLLVLGEDGEPNHAQIAAMREQVEAILAAGEVSRFVVRTIFAEASELIFVAPDLPPCGYATFSVRAAQPQEIPSAAALENDLFALQADPGDGTLTLTDKVSGIVYPGLNRFVDG